MFSTLMEEVAFGRKHSCTVSELARGNYPLATITLPNGTHAVRTVQKLPELDLKTIAIDFETANEQRGSACSVGLAWIEDGRVTRVEERLIRPKTMRFSSFNIAIHGIRPEAVEDAGEFPEVMDEFADDFRDATMIAHNAAFDFSVWRACLDQYGQSYPDLSYLCSVKMAQKVWPDLGSHKLNILASYLGLTFAHHNAAEDAAICAEAAISMARSLRVTHVREVPARIGMKAGRLFAGGYEACTCRRSSKAPEDAPSRPQTSVTKALARNASQS